MTRRTPVPSVARAIDAGATPRWHQASLCAPNASINQCIRASDFIAYGIGSTASITIRSRGFLAGNGVNF